LLPPAFGGAWRPRRRSRMRRWAACGGGGAAGYWPPGRVRSLRWLPAPPPPTRWPRCTAATWSGCRRLRAASAHPDAPHGSAPLRLRMLPWTGAWLRSAPLRLPYADVTRALRAGTTRRRATATLPRWAVLRARLAAAQAAAAATAGARTPEAAAATAAKGATAAKTPRPPRPTSSRPPSASPLQRKAQLHGPAHPTCACLRAHAATPRFSASPRAGAALPRRGTHAAARLRCAFRPWHRLFPNRPRRTPRATAPPARTGSSPAWSWKSRRSSSRHV